MNTKKHHPNDKLQKSSKLFLQLGLILALLVCYSFLEMSTLQKTQIACTLPSIDPGPYVFSEPPIIVIEKDEPLKNKTKLQLSKTDIKQIKNDEPVIKEILDTISKIDNDKIDKAIDNLPPDNSTIDDEVEPIPFIFLEEIPIYPGCENLDIDASKQCFTKELSKFVNKKFNTELASELGLYGKQNIYVQFVIDKSGKVTNIMARAPHKKLEEEAIDIIGKLPKMTPGKQRTKPVPVKYTLPIKFEIYN